MSTLAAIPLPATTIDNLSPGDVTAATATSGNAQVSLSWTNPGDADLCIDCGVRRTTSVVTDTPVEGTTYTVGTVIGSSTVACVVSAPTATCTDTGLTNGTAYYHNLHEGFERQLFGVRHHTHRVAGDAKRDDSCDWVRIRRTRRSSQVRRPRWPMRSRSRPAAARTPSPQSPCLLEPAHRRV